MQIIWRSLIIVSVNMTAVIEALSDMKPVSATNLECLSPLQLNLPYCIAQSRSISRQLREIFLDTRRRFLVEILVVGFRMLFFSDCKEYQLVKQKLYFNSPKSGIPVRQNLRIIKRSGHPEFFVRKRAGTKTTYNVFILKIKL